MKQQLDKMQRIATGLGGMYADMVKGAPQLQRGMVWCKTCGRSKKVDSAHCLRYGWPKCHGYTMSLDAPA